MNWSWGIVARIKSTIPQMSLGVQNPKSWLGQAVNS